MFIQEIRHILSNPIAGPVICQTGIAVLSACVEGYYFGLTAGIAALALGILRQAFPPEVIWSAAKRGASTLAGRAKVITSSVVSKISGWVFRPA
jgi:hypothetical protein